MKTIPTTVCAAAAALLVGIAALPAARASDTATTKPTAATNAKCPISGDAIDPKVTAVYNGKAYAFCCADCVKSFNADPAKYAAKVK